MSDHDIESIRDLLVQRAGLSEIRREVARFQCNRRDKDGSDRNVIIEILDAGPGGDTASRYTVWAFDEGGRIALGNGGATIDEAIEVTQWHKLDTDVYASKPPWKAFVGG